MAYEAPLVVHDTGGDKLRVKSGGEIVVESGGTVTLEAGATLNNAGTEAHTGTQSFDDIVGNDTSLAITGKAGAAGAGGAVAVAGGVGDTNQAGGAASVTGGAGAGTGAGAVGSVVGGASGAGATGNGGNAAVTGGAAASTNGSGGSVVLTGGAKAGTGIAGGIFGRSNRFQAYPAPGAGTDQNEVLTAAQMINAIFVHTIAQGRTLTTPTGAALSAGCPAEVAVGDCFLFHVITVGTGADDIVTLTAGDGDVTFVGKVTIGPDTAAIAAYATFLFRKTGASSWVGYRIG